MTRLAIATLAVVTGLSVACGPTGPSSVSGSQDPTATGVWAPDTAAVSAGIVAELHALGVEAAVADRFGGAPFSVGMQRVALPSISGNNIYLFVYRTAALAADEASRIRPDGNVLPVEGPIRVIVDYIGTQHFYYRDRVIARHSGCDATVEAAMETLFGPPVVVTSSTCRSIFTSLSGESQPASWMTPRMRRTDPRVRRIAFGCGDVTTATKRARGSPVRGEWWVRSAAGDRSVT